MKIRQWEPSCSLRTDRQTDMTKLIVAFLNFTNATKKHTSCPTEYLWEINEYYASNVFQIGRLALVFCHDSSTVVYFVTFIRYISRLFYCLLPQCSFSCSLLWRMTNGQATPNNVSAPYRWSISDRATWSSRKIRSVMDRESNYLAALRSTLNWPLCINMLFRDADLLGIIVLAAKIQ